MRILLTGTLVFLLWAFAASWFYVCKIKPYCESPSVPAIAADTLTPEPSPPVIAEAPRPGTLILYFDYNKADVNPSAEDDKHAMLFSDWIGKHPEANLSITGHADSKGPDTYNLKLGTKRAESALTYIAGKGTPSKKISTGSKGEKEPASDNTTEEGRAKNRRVEITLK